MVDSRSIDREVRDRLSVEGMPFTSISLQWGRDREVADSAWQRSRKPRSVPCFNGAATVRSRIVGAAHCQVNESA